MRYTSDLLRGLDALMVVPLFPIWTIGYLLRWRHKKNPGLLRSKAAILALVNLVWCFTAWATLQGFVEGGR